MVGLIMLENNCTNCKYMIPVEGADYGFCNFKTRLGDIANVHTVCSDYEAKEALKNTIDEMSLEVLEALKCCTENGEGCETCPFANYKCTCRHDLMFAARQLIHKQMAYIEELERLVGGYAADQEIWLTRNDALEKENKSLWDSYHKGYAVGYEYGKQDALTADKAEPTNNNKTEYDRGYMVGKVHGMLSMLDSDNEVEG
jgi:hypothetical protein